MLIGKDGISVGVHHDKAGRLGRAFVSLAHEPHALRLQANLKIAKVCYLKRGLVEHAMRFTVRNTRRAHVYPATHYAGRKTDENLPRMGERFRLRQDFDTSGFSPHAKAILKGLQKYGMFVADNGGDWRLSVAPDSRIKGLNELRKVKGRDFEVIVPTGPDEGPRAKQ